ncbi:MAG: isoamylase early set domain-containing protein [Saprospiraceae bacterium]|nr:isoamylase early set domain-containing protein [Saprospiraceae bacterium]
MSVTKKMQAGKGTCQLTFELPLEVAQGANQIQVLGDFNDWNPTQAPAMKKGKSAYTAQLSVEAGTSYQFKYLIDGQQWMNDNQADRYVAGPFGSENSVLDVPAASTEKSAAAPKATKKLETKSDAPTAAATLVAPKAKKAATKK